MNKKFKEQLELVLIQCSSLKAQLDEAAARNKEYEKELAHLNEVIASLNNAADTVTKTDEAECEMTSQDEETEVSEEVEVSEETETPCEEALPEDIAKKTDDNAEAPQEAIVPLQNEPEQNPASTVDISSGEPLKDDSDMPELPTTEDVYNFQSILEIGTDMVSQAVASSQEYIEKFKVERPESYHNLSEIIRSRTELFKYEISGIISGYGDVAEKREKMNALLIKLIQYFENVK